MTNSKKVLLSLGSFLMLLLCTQNTFAQTFEAEKESSSVKIEGTSNVHDWEEDAEDFEGKLTAELEDGKLVKLEKLKFSVVSESLKSGKNKMDKNTYKALKTDAHKNITYELQKVNSIDCNVGNHCSVSASGFLTIAGTKKSVDLIFDTEVQQGKLLLKGTTDITMTDYNIDPPKALFGTIKTGDDIQVKFEIVFNQ